jgi:ParB family chromosome partitioning protein
MEKQIEQQDIPQDGDIVYVDINELQPNPYQPKSRLEVPEEVAKKFGLSILEHGLLQTPIATFSYGHYEVGDGWLRRSGYEWLTKNGHPEFSKMPVSIRTYDAQQMADLIMEANTVRQDMNPIELAWYYRKYLSDFKWVTQTEFAKRHNITQGELANRMRLLDLPEEIQDMIISQKISETHGRMLLQIKDKKQRLLYAESTELHGWSVAKLSEEIKIYQMPKTRRWNTGVSGRAGAGIAKRQPRKN